MALNQRPHERARARTRAWTIEKTVRWDGTSGMPFVLVPSISAYRGFPPRRRRPKVDTALNDLPCKWSTREGEDGDFLSPPRLRPGDWVCHSPTPPPSPVPEVDVAVEHEAMSGMVRVAIAHMKAELDSLLRRVNSGWRSVHPH